MNILAELKRRNVFRVGIAYAVAAWVFLQVADLALDAMNAPDWVLQALMLLIALGFVASLIIAWAYEITPEGIKRDKDVRRGESIAHETANKLNRITIALVVVALVVVVADRLVPRQYAESEMGSGTLSLPETVPDPIPESEQNPASPDEKSVAVLPFVNMSSDPEQEFFSDGISEEILNVLTRIPGLKVAARTSSFQFKGQNQDIAAIARQLRVNHVLEGSVRKSGDRIRITAQLIEAETGFHVWSDTFDRQLEDVFAIQDEISGAIATELRARLADEPLAASTPVAMGAYDLYLKGRGLVATRQGSALVEAMSVLQSALDIAPDYAPAMATLAKAYVVLPYFSEQIPSGKARSEARRWAEKALALEPANTEALSIMGIVYNEVDLDPGKAIAVLEQAVQANPGSVDANNFLGDVYTRIGNLDRAMIFEAKAAELDPLGPVMLTDLANVYQLQGDFVKSLELTKRALELNPNFLHALIQQTDVYFIFGDNEQFVLAAQQLAGASDIGQRDLDGVRTQKLILSGQMEQARGFVKQRIKQAERGELSAASLAMEAVQVRDFDTAGYLLQLAHEQGDGTWAYPLWVRLPEQAPDSEPWQAFWKLPGPARFAELRRQNGFEPNPPYLERYRSTQ